MSLENQVKIGGAMSKNVRNSMLTALKYKNFNILQWLSGCDSFTYLPTYSHTPNLEKLLHLKCQIAIQCFSLCRQSPFSSLYSTAFKFGY